MDRALPGSLSPIQRACLDQVLALRTTKEIARALDLPPSTIDFHIKEACHLLGVSSRSQAARLWDTQKAQEGGELQPSESSIQAPDLEPQLTNVDQNLIALTRLGERDHGRFVVNRLFAIFAIAVGSILALAGLLASLDAIGRHLH